MRQEELRAKLAEALRTHQPPTHVDSEGLPPDEFDCCVDAVMDVIGSALEDLQADSRRLAALYGAGVDNWEGYDYAMELLRENS